MASNYQSQKSVVLNYFHELENASLETILSVIKAHTTGNYSWIGYYPFREQSSVEAVVDVFWKPLLKSVKHLQRRQDIFIAGTNKIDPNETWVMSMGHFMGLFDSDWLGIRATHKMLNIRYVEFSCVEGDKIGRTALFIDLIGVMDQAGMNPLPPETGRYFVYPGPRHHNGLLFNETPEEEEKLTFDLVNRMINDLFDLNDSGSMRCPPHILEKSWAKDMIWYGPCGIGASYTIPRYQKQHQLPFREALKDKQANNHVCYFAEGNFACFFGWPNLSHTPIGGFLGLPGGQINVKMECVDVYSRIGDKLSENWVFMDIPFWLKQQNLDVLKRTVDILNPSE